MSWRRRINTKRVSDETLKAYIDNRLSRTQDRRESISYLVQSIRDQGMSFPTRHTFSMDEFERLGYKMVSDRNQWGAMLRTYVLAREKVA